MNDEFDPSHYADEGVEILCAGGLCMWVGVNWLGKTAVRSFDDNMFSEWDMLDMFRELADPEEAGYKERLEAFARWVVKTGGDRRTVLDWPGFDGVSDVNI